MSLSLFITTASSTIIVCLIAYRSVEIFKGKYFLDIKKRSFADDLIHKIILAVLKNADKIKKTLKRHLYLLPGRILNLTYILWSKMKRRVDHFYNKFQNKKM